MNIPRCNQYKADIYLFMGKLTVVVFISTLLSACTTQVVRKIDTTPPDQIAIAQDESQLLDIGIAIFDPNVPDDYDERIAQIISPDVRQAESQYIPYVTKNLLQSTGNWGAVRVVPRPSDAVDVTVSGKILASTGEELILSMSVAVSYTHLTLPTSDLV